MKLTDTPSLSSEFHKARNYLVIFASALLAWQFLGLELDNHIPFTDWKIQKVQYIPHVLSLAVLYHLIRIFIEWLQSSAESRAKLASKCDLFITLTIACSALFPFGLSLAIDAGLSKMGLSCFSGLVVAGFWIGVMLDLVIFGSLMIRTQTEARSKELPRVPAASKAVFFAAVITVVPLIIAMIVLSRWMPMPVKNWWFVVPILPALIPPTTGLWNLARFKDSDGRQIPFRERIQTFKRIHDTHDHMYKVGGTIQGALQRGIDPLNSLHRVYKQEKDINPEIYNAAEQGDDVQVQECLNRSASPNVVAWGGWTPLMIATANGHASTVCLLLRSGAEPNVKNLMGRSPLHFASRYGLTAIAKLLVEYSADVNVLDFEEKQTPLFWSARIGDIQTASMLIDAGADVKIKDRNGKTADFFAKENRHGDLVKLLREQQKLIE